MLPVRISGAAHSPRVPITDARIGFSAQIASKVAMEASSEDQKSATRARARGYPPSMLCGWRFLRSTSAVLPELASQYLKFDARRQSLKRRQPAVQRAAELATLPTKRRLRS